MPACRHASNQCRALAAHQHCLGMDSAQGQHQRGGAQAGMLGWQLTGWSGQCWGCLGGSCGRHCPPCGAWLHRLAGPTHGMPPPGHTQPAAAEPSPHLLSSLHNRDTHKDQHPAHRQNKTPMAFSILAVQAEQQSHTRVQHCYVQNNTNVAG